jgi:Cell division protein
MRALQYALEEAFTSLWRGRQAGLLSTLTIALALFVLGGFLVVTANLERLGAEWSNSAELSIYLKDDITRRAPGARDGAGPSDLVAAHEYVSKSDALARFKQTFGDLAAAVDGAGGNPLPASLEVRLRPGPGVSGGVDSLASQLRRCPGLPMSATIGNG